MFASTANECMSFGGESKSKLELAQLFLPSSERTHHDDDIVSHNDIISLIQKINGENTGKLDSLSVQRATRNYDSLSQEVDSLKKDKAAIDEAKVAYEIKEIEWKIVNKERHRNNTSVQKVTQQLIASQSKTIEHLEARVSAQVTILDDKVELIRFKDGQLQELEERFRKESRKIDLVERGARCEACSDSAEGMSTKSTSSDVEGVQTDLSSPPSHCVNNLCSDTTAPRVSLSEVATLKAEIGSLQQQLELKKLGAEQKLAEAASEVTAVKSELSAAKSEACGLRERNNSLLKSGGAARDRITCLETKNATLRDEHGWLLQQITELMETGGSGQVSTQDETLQHKMIKKVKSTTIEESAAISSSTAAFSDLCLFVRKLKEEILQQHEAATISEQNAETLSLHMSECKAAYDSAIEDNATLSTRLQEITKTMVVVEGELTDSKKLFGVANNALVELDSTMRKTASKCGVDDISSIGSLFLELKEEAEQARLKIDELESTIKVMDELAVVNKLDMEKREVLLKIEKKNYDETLRVQGEIASECGVKCLSEIPDAFKKATTESSNCQLELMGCIEKLDALQKEMGGARTESSTKSGQPQIHESHEKLASTQNDHPAPLPTRETQSCPVFQQIMKEYDVADNSAVFSFVSSLKDKEYLSDSDIYSLRSEITQINGAFRKQESISKSELQELEEGSEQLSLDKDCLVDQGTFATSRELEMILGDMQVDSLADLRNLIDTLKVRLDEAQSKTREIESEYRQVVDDMVEADAAVNDAVERSANLSSELQDTTRRLDLTKRELAECKESLVLSNKATIEADQNLALITNECGVAIVSELPDVFSKIRGDLNEAYRTIAEKETQLSSSSRKTEHIESQQNTSFSRESKSLSQDFSMEFKEISEKLAYTEAELADCNELLALTLPVVQANQALESIVKDFALTDVSELRTLISSLKEQVLQQQDTVLSAQQETENLNLQISECKAVSDIAVEKSTALSTQLQEKTTTILLVEDELAATKRLLREAKSALAEVERSRINTTMTAPDVDGSSQIYTTVKNRSEAPDASISHNPRADNGPIGDNCKCDSRDRILQLNRKVQRKEADLKSLQSERLELQNQLTLARTALWDLEDERAYSRAKLVEFSRLIERPLASEVESKLHETTIRCAEAIGMKDSLQEKVYRFEQETKKLEKDLEEKNSLIQQLQRQRGILHTGESVRSIQEDHERALQSSIAVSAKMAESQAQVQGLRDRLKKGRTHP